MSRRSANKEKDIKVFMQDELLPKISKIMVNRHILMAPFPLPPMDIYKLLWTDAEREALAVLTGNRVLKTNRVFDIASVPAPVDGSLEGVAVNAYVITVVCEKEVPLPRDVHVKFATLPGEMQAAIQAWIPEWLRYYKETNSLTEAVLRVSRVCSTWGQVIRIWPELQGFLGEWGREKVHNAKAKSAYPPDALYSDGTLMETFEPAAFAPFTNMIAESLMLPVIDDLYNVGSVGAM